MQPHLRSVKQTYQLPHQLLLNYYHCRYSHVEHPSHRVIGAACSVAGLHLIGPHLGAEGDGKDGQT